MVGERLKPHWTDDMVSRSIVFSQTSSQPTHSVSCSFCSLLWVLDRRLDVIASLLRSCLQVLAGVAVTEMTVWKV